MHVFVCRYFISRMILPDTSQASGSAIGIGAETGKYKQQGQVRLLPGIESRASISHDSDFFQLTKPLGSRLKTVYHRRRRAI